MSNDMSYTKFKVDRPFGEIEIAESGVAKPQKVANIGNAIALAMIDIFIAYEGSESIVVFRSNDKEDVNFALGGAPDPANKQTTHTIIIYHCQRSSRLLADFYAENEKADQELLNIINNIWE
jgi:hypothetical protein